MWSVIRNIPHCGRKLRGAVHEVSRAGKRSKQAEVWQNRWCVGVRSRRESGDFDQIAVAETTKAELLSQFGGNLIGNGGFFVNAIALEEKRCHVQGLML